MKLHETPFLTSDLLMARVKQRDFKAKDWRRHEEVTVRAQGDQLLLRQDDRIVELELVTTPDGDRLYFVEETKSGSFDDDIRNAEAAKIACGREHFKALSAGEHGAIYDKLRM